MRIHCAAAAIVIGSGFYFHISRGEWLVLLLTIGVVMSLEIVNTAIESTVDLVSAKWDPLAKLAKDAAAGAVLLFAGISIAIGIIIFWPYVLRSLAG